MVNIKKTNQAEFFNLSKKYTVYKIKYNNRYSKDSFLKRTKENESLYFNRSYKNENSLDIHLECDEFTSVDNQVCKFLNTELNYNKDKVAKSSWVYIQIPPNMKEGDGNIIFKSEDKKHHTFIPEVNDIFIFPGDLKHLVMPSQSGTIDRVVYASNLNSDFNYKTESNKKIKFDEIY